MTSPMPVVSNTSPIWNLASIGQLGLLHDQFYDVRVPQAVLDELLFEHDSPEAELIKETIRQGWLKVEPLTDRHTQRSLMLQLDRGEAAAIALALELGIDRILMDELEGRKTAKVMGLQPTGILGVLLRAKNEGKIVSLTDEMKRLRGIAGFFIAEPLFRQLLQEANE
ncbi:MAG: DUF3368 domain-containing protein [Desulfurivibrio sp.]|nr:DUF3368 domain-containing protein [Desulfurivibrio sp.]